MGRKGITLLELFAVIAIVGMVTLAMTPFIRSVRELSRRHECAKNIRRLTLALNEYAVNHDGRYPQDLSELYPPYVDMLGVFMCPSDMDASVIASDGSDINTTTSYHYSRGWTVRDGLDTILVCDKNDIFGKDTNHDGKGGNVAYLSGVVKWVDTEEWVPPVDKQ